MIVGENSGSKKNIFNKLNENAAPWIHLYNIISSHLLMDRRGRVTANIKNHLLPFLCIM